MWKRRRSSRRRVAAGQVDDGGRMETDMVVSYSLQYFERIVERVGSVFNMSVRMDT